ncbi:phasin family protein [Carnobacterium funditum]|uniref:phasin family protein n=1 Tax=Carnobacterium funditum TaxID=2752 RepID=UPI00068F89C5|nr:hypothetical protein [Carnobacterium funditum]
MMEELKKLVFAGIGGASLTYEKAQEVVDHLEKKGKLSVDEGKRLKEELLQRKSNKKEESLNHDDVETQLIEMTATHRKDIDELERKVEELTKKVDDLWNK